MTAKFNPSAWHDTTHPHHPRTPPHPTPPTGLEGEAGSQPRCPPSPARRTASQIPSSQSQAPPASSPGGEAKAASSAAAHAAAAAAHDAAAPAAGRLGAAASVATEASASAAAASSSHDPGPGPVVTVTAADPAAGDKDKAAPAMGAHMEGFLLKKSYITYRPRYFLLDGSNLLYKASKEDARARNLMTLTTDSSVTEFRAKRGACVL